MSGRPLQLHGEVDNRDSLIESMQDDIRRLEDELRTARADAEREKRNTALALGSLRRTLSPLYRALQTVFGELDAAGVAEEAQPAGRFSPAVSSVWESWKQKLGGKKAAVIEALQAHGEMTVPQLRVATKSGQQTIYEVTSALNKLGLIDKHNGRYSLKQL